MRHPFVQSLATFALVAIGAAAIWSGQSGVMMASPRSAPETADDQAIASNGDDPLQLAVLCFAQAEPAVPIKPKAPDTRTKSATKPDQSISDAASPDHDSSFEFQGVQWNDELITRCIEVAHDVDPELATQLAEKRLKNPKEFDEAIQHGAVGQRLLAMVQLKVRDPNLYDLKISEMAQSLLINRTAKQLQLAMQGVDQGKTEALKEQLRSQLQIQMAMSIKARGEYICKIEDQIKVLRAELEHDAKNFNAIIDGRLQQYMQQPPKDDSEAIVPAAATQREPRKPGIERTRQR